MIISSINSYIASDKYLVKQGYSFSDTCCYYICKDGLPIGFPSESLPNITYFSLENFKGLSNLFKRELKKGISAIFVNVKLINNQLVIVIAGRNIKRLKKKRIDVVVGDWGIFIYEYSCSKQEWELKETKYGGI